MLSDPQKRKRYDEYGSDDTELRRRSRPNGYEHDFSRGFESKCHFVHMFVLCVTPDAVLFGLNYLRVVL